MTKKYYEEKNWGESIFFLMFGCLIVMAMIAIGILAWQIVAACTENRAFALGTLALFFGLVGYFTWYWKVWKKNG
jgi:hypothetical protein